METLAKFDILSKVKSTVVLTLRVPSDKLDVDMKLEGFGLDSIIAMELMTNISRAFGITITPAQFIDITTVRELAQYIETNYAIDKSKLRNEMTNESKSLSSRNLPELDAEEQINNDKLAKADSITDSYQELLTFVQEKYSLDLSNFQFDNIDDLVDVMLANHLDELMLHYEMRKGISNENSENDSSKESIDDSRKIGTLQSADVAIIGIACQFPDSPSPQDFWDNLVGENNSLREIPKTRWNWQDCYAESATPSQTTSKWGALIDNIDCFDSDFFDISPSEASLMDPQERLLCQEVYNAIQDSGINRQDISGSNTGVFVGYEYAEYEHYLRKNHQLLQGRLPLSSSSPTYYLSNRLSYLFDFCGPSESINSSCSSSAVAINRAYYSLLNGESDLAIACGVSLNLFADDYITLTQHGLLSPNGTCAVFDEAANGYTRGEGVGVVVLKRLKDARNDNDRIYTLIKSCHQNNRGHAKSMSEIKFDSITNVMTDCYKKASISPDTVNYIEVNGYAKKWADSFEFEGIKNVFKNSGTKEKHCALGSLKGNIGHLEPANGIAGVIKVALSMHNKKFPPIISTTNINEFIDIKSPAHPLYIADKIIHFDDIRQTNKFPIRAGINSFSDSGSNVHILLEECMDESALTSSQVTTRQLFILSAKDRHSLKRYVESFTGFLSQYGSSINFQNMAYTLQNRREFMDERLAIIADSKAEFLEKLQLFSQTDEGKQELLEEQEIFSGNVKVTSKNSLSKIISKELVQQIVESSLKTQRRQEVALLWINGETINWADFWKNRFVEPVSLPNYPFAKTKYNIETPFESAKQLESSDDTLTLPENCGDTEVISPKPAYQAASNETEQQLVEIWAQVLNLESRNIGVNDNFFEMGGHSLLATQIASKIRNELKVDLPLTAFLDVNTVAGIAEVVNSINYQQLISVEEEINVEEEFEEGAFLELEDNLSIPVDSDDDKEKHQLLIDFNQTQVDFQKDKCIHQLFVEQAELNPDKIAVEYQNDQLTYQQLYDKSQQLALHLQSLGVQPDSLVALWMENSLDMIVAILGILQAGGAYVPMDPGCPENRLLYILEDSQASIVITQKKLKNTLSSLVNKKTHLIALDQQWKKITQSVARLKAKEVELQNEVKSYNLAYVIYTSGTTGKPKGVMVEHKSLHSLCVWHNTAFDVIATSKAMQTANISFDAAVWEIWPYLTKSACVLLVKNEVVLDSRKLARFIEQNKVTHCFLVTPIAQQLLQANELNQSQLKYLLIGGDKFSDYEDRSYPFIIVNNYGPTETTVVATSYKINKEFTAQIIGKPISNTQIYILDGNNRPVSVGVEGELHIAGEGLARGYLNRKSLTQEKFISNPFNSNTRMYKSGDLARWLSDGNIEFLGRVDSQVKIRGYRIETGEIETQLNLHHQIKNCVVVAQNEKSNKKLIAFYLASATKLGNVAKLNDADLKVHLEKYLPDYMLPSAFISLESIPLTSNGKVDRIVLENMKVKMESNEEYMAPRNNEEQMLITIWAQLLALDTASIGVKDNFFELGGHSLLATQLISRVRDKFAVDLSLSVLFKKATVEEIAQIIGRTTKNRVPPILPFDSANVDQLQQVSFAQERLWFIDQLESGSVSYNIPIAYTVNGKLNVDHVEQAIKLIIARHENLRTVFPSQDGKARQLVLDSFDFELIRIDLSHYKNRKAKDKKAKQLCNIEAGNSFNLADGPLIRGQVIKLSQQKHILMLCMHHIIVDLWSIGVLLKEYAVIMNNLSHDRNIELPSLPIQYLDYSVWQRKMLQEEGVLKQQLQYWQSKLEGVPESVSLVTDFPRPKVQSFIGATKEFTISSRLTERLKIFSERQGCTLYMILLSIFKVLLYRYTGQSDICIGSPIANRQYGETERLIGMFVNTLPLRTFIMGEQSITSILAAVKETCLEAYDNQDAPFEKIVDLVQPQRNMSISPLCQIMLVLQNAPSEPVNNLKPYSLQRSTSNFDLTFEFIETQDGITGSVEFCRAIFKSITIERMINHFVSLCEVALDFPSIRISELEYIDKTEKQKLLKDFNRTKVDYSDSKCIHEMFTEQAGLNPNKTSVIYKEQGSESKQLTYQELDEKSNVLALYLQSLDVKPDDLVGLCVSRSLDMMIGILGILKSGGAYVPLDPDYPSSRLDYMLKDSRVSFVVTQQAFCQKLNDIIENETRLITLDREWTEISQRVVDLKAKNINLQQRSKPHHLAYVIYTSGSTGKPKGVMNIHSNVRRIVKDSNYLEVESNDEVVSLSSYIFDGSIFDLFTPLSNGACLILLKDILDVGYLEDVFNNNSIVFMTTALFNSIVNNEVSVLNKPKAVLFGGEEVSTFHVEKALAVNPKLNLLHVYGPTETTVFASFHNINSASLINKNVKTIPIGRPVTNTQLYILDQHYKPQPLGVIGELYISGQGLARGYLNQPDLTREKFIANPFEPGCLMYKSGDLARWSIEGDIEFFGRKDTQVKIRGFRIETGEIETQLNHHADIITSFVMVKGKENNKQLIAFYLAAATKVKKIFTLDSENIQTHLRKVLPEYMLPAAFISLERIPLTSNGKIDRRALESIDVNLQSKQAYLGPRSEVERQLIVIWAQVLNLRPEKIGVNDNFFELGGHSLLVTQVVAMIRSQLRIEVPLKAVFNAITIAGIAEVISAVRQQNIQVSETEDMLDVEFEEGTL